MDGDKNTAEGRGEVMIPMIPNEAELHPQESSDGLNRNSRSPSTLPSMSARLCRLPSCRALSLLLLDLAVV